ncbi:methyltransferase domain-containing protein [Aureococcus anophagefferens]|nr:methyltransferase domain-containing protein [Aureococcus anophagefferens]
MEGLTQPPVSPERDGGEGFVLTQPPCVDEAGADAPPRIAFVLRPTAAAAAASTEPVELVAESTVVVGREPPADILLVDMERTATTTLRPFVSASHATLRVALEDGMDVAYVATHTMSDGKTAAGLWLGGERLAAGQERRIAVGATLRFGTLKDEASMPYDKFNYTLTRLNIDMAPLRTGRGRTDETTTTTKLTRNQKKRKRRKQDKDDLQDELDRVKDDGTPRAASFFCVDRFSSAFLSTIPVERRVFSAPEWGEANACYFGTPSPLCAPLIGRTLPGGAKLDAYGAKLSTEHSILNLESRRTDYHNAVLAQIHDSARQAGLPAQREPRGLLFSTGLTAAGRAAGFERDAAVMLGDARDATAGDGGRQPRRRALLQRRTARQERDAGPRRRALDKVRRIFDVKTLAWSAADSNYYSTAASAESVARGQAGVLDNEYKAHAKQIDVEINGVSDGPMLRALSSLGGCVGLVFGQFSEASKDVSSLLADVATALSESRWISMGCACPDQAKALLSNELHREWGTTAAKYRARYLISGLKFVDGTWTSKARALSHRLEDDARRLADRAALATLTTNLRCDG